MINWMKYRALYFSISAVVILSGMFSMLKWGINFGVEFKGGTLIEYKVSTETLQSVVETIVGQQGLQLVSYQQTDSGSFILKLGEVTPSQREMLKVKLSEAGGNAEELRFESVGPVVGQELIKKTVYGLVIAAVSILLWVALQFKSIKFGVSAVLAMIHDSLVTIGIYSIIAHFYGAEIDLLFVTAVLTILSFSVHDTIVLYDRIRELKKGSLQSINDLANTAISETMVRSLNNSFVVLIMMAALLLMGGVTIKWFIATLLVGTITGAYSSPFVAVPILVTWDELQKKYKK